MRPSSAKTLRPWAIAALLVAFPLAGCSSAPDLVASVSGTVQQGPSCPVETQQSPCPPARAAHVAVELRNSDEVVARTTTDADGYFQLDAPAGDFDLVASRTEGLPSEDMEHVHLDSGDDLLVDLMLDSGIR